MPPMSLSSYLKLDGIMTVMTDIQSKAHFLMFVSYRGKVDQLHHEMDDRFTNIFNVMPSANSRQKPTCAAVFLKLHALYVVLLKFLQGEIPLTTTCLILIVWFHLKVN